MNIKNKILNLDLLEKTIGNPQKMTKKQFEGNIQIGFTLTFDNDNDSIKFEPNASLPDKRIDAIKFLFDNNIKTWASFEPVIYPEQSLNLIKKTLNFIGSYKIGKINNYNQLDKEINWSDFLCMAVEILRNANKPFYVKDDLRFNALNIKLYGNEVLCDELNFKGWIE